MGSSLKCIYGHFEGIAPRVNMGFGEGRHTYRVPDGQGRHPCGRLGGRLGEGDATAQLAGVGIVGAAQRAHADAQLVTRPLHRVVAHPVALAGYQERLALERQARGARDADTAPGAGPALPRGRRAGSRPGPAGALRRVARGARRRAWSPGACSRAGRKERQQGAVAKAG